MKWDVVVLCVLMGWASVSWAGSRSQISLLASSGLTNQVSIQPAQDFAINQLGKAPVYDVHYATVTVTTNGDFGMTLRSENQGDLVRTLDQIQPAFPLRENDRVPYTVTVIEGGFGTLGMPMPPYSQRSGLSLVSEKTIRFEREDGQKKSVTDNKTFHLLLTTPQMNQLNQGEYMDKITVEIFNLDR